MIQLKCQVTGNPEPEVTWLFETKHVVPCQDKRITMKAGLATLTILSVQLEDAGIYACEISNGVGNKLSCTCKVVVMEDRTKKFGGKTPNFDKVISDAQTIPGNRARFICIARGNPKPKITWFHDDVPVVETENIKFTNDGNKYEMEIMRVSEGDTGAYLCKATNSIGMRDCKAKLSTGETGQQNETPKIKVPPSFIQVADNRILKEGEPVSFEFKFKGQPQPTVVWKFNGKSILRADRHAISQPETGTARLAIHSPRASDCGEYTCVVYNSEGETSSIVHLSKGKGIFCLLVSIGFLSISVILPAPLFPLSSPSLYLPFPFPYPFPFPIPLSLSSPPSPLPLHYPSLLIPLSPLLRSPSQYPVQLTGCNQVIHSRT